MTSVLQVHCVLGTDKGCTISLGGIVEIQIRLGCGRAHAEFFLALDDHLPKELDLERELLIQRIQ